MDEEVSPGHGGSLSGKPWQGAGRNHAGVVKRMAVSPQERESEKERRTPKGSGCEICSAHTEFEGLWGLRL